MAKKLVLISGASKGIGKAFLERYKTVEDVVAIGMNRTGSAGVGLDLMDVGAVNEFVSGLDLGGVENLVYIHGIGVDKFEPKGLPHIDEDGDGIDDEVMDSNYTTFVNFVDPLVEKVNRDDIPLTLCAIGSISDVFEVPYWKSFWRVKNMVRKYCKAVSHDLVRSVILNVSSTLDNNGRVYGRVHADTTYWQTAFELVAKSFDAVDGFQKGDCSYAEFDFFKPDPNFRSDYFTDLDRLYETWQKDLGFEGKDIPLGIRI
jgi:NAD(P)-dependent dehydrogenase (short-subunit alcohol dehydrogenase family)